jgi:UDP-2-acetamido-2,6-beta-L-arabino-hexul-4-ose reductase
MTTPTGGVAVTGAHGFLGWHLSCRLAATRGIEPVRLGRPDLADEGGLHATLSGVNTVIHLAGVNRADSDKAIETENVESAEALAAALGDRPVHVVFADSIQVDLDNAYGRGKRKAAEILGGLPGTFADVLLPNLFGEHGRPAYNSFVATFCHEVATGGEPHVHEDRQVQLLHTQAAAEGLIAAAERRETATIRPQGEARGVAEVLEMLRGFHALYAKRGEIPNLSTKFERDLFNTYRSYLFPHAYPIHPKAHADQRGVLVEAVRSHGGTSQVFASSTVPDGLRGDHYHLHKFERFMVVRGEAEIALRRLYHDAVVRFRVSGSEAGFVDMPTMWVHALRNVGTDDLVTMFWTDQLLDPEDPDQYAEEVSPR